ncbi:MAG: ferredoxin [Endomicrobia bacterium]|nr:ferredoxin [Endomicrobiia bacterium]MCX7716044.1 ferredoxin [Endomicrobiia bacterium]
MKVKIDKDLCTACGLCADSCPEVFVMGEDTAVVKTELVPVEYEQKVKEAAQNCPTEAIKIE